MTIIYQQLPFNYVLRTLYKMLLMCHCHMPHREYYYSLKYITDGAFL